jgi:glycosyltransferase involved in cell wall biosynthesis
MAVSVWSNSPGQPTGYGEQAKYLIDNLKRDGFNVAALSNYGLEGAVSTYETPYGTIPHYPRGVDLYSNDVVGLHHKHFTNQFPDEKHLLVTLYDVWVLKSKVFDDYPTASWTPLDHVTMPPLVEEFLRKETVLPISMSPHGQRQMDAKGIENTYIPHGIDTNVFKPTDMIGEHQVTDFLGSKDKFVVGMVAANKASGLVHRKAFGENILAFSLFHKKYPDTMLYLHTDPFGAQGGWNLFPLLSALGIPKEAVSYPNPIDYKYKIAQQDLAGIYTGIDVLLAAGYGEGFGVPTVEAQACGTRVIGSSWAATPDLLSDDCWMVEGQLTWDAGQNAFWQVPQVMSIVSALEEAYNAGKGRSQVSIDFAQQFDVEKVWDESWKPFLKKHL